MLVELKGKASFDQLHRSFQRDAAWCKNQVNVIWHNDKIMQEILTPRFVIEHDVYEEQGDLLDLKQTSFSQGHLQQQSKWIQKLLRDEESTTDTSFKPT